MDKLILNLAIAEVLDGKDIDFLCKQLGRKTDTIYRLATLKNKMRKDPSPVGICSEIWNYDIVEALSPTWKHFSGSIIYPVPGLYKDRDPELAYCEDFVYQDKWKGQQKRYRFSLIDHLLKYAPTYYQAVEKRLKQY